MQVQRKFHIHYQCTRGYSTRCLQRRSLSDTHRPPLSARLKPYEGTQFAKALQSQQVKVESMFGGGSGSEGEGLKALSPKCLK